MLSSVCTSIFFLVVARVPRPEAVDLHSADGRLLRGQLQVNSVVASNATENSLEALGGSCSCAFSGLCSCVQALEFMKCIRDACDSGACDCQKHHYFYACHSMSAECPTAELKCGVKEATCKKVPPMVTESSLEIVGDIEVMQGRKCKLKQATADGWINGPVRIAELQPQIQDRSEVLKRRGIDVPDLGCSDEDTESFHEFKAGLKAQAAKEDDAAKQQVSKKRKVVMHKRVKKVKKAKKRDKQDVATKMPLAQILANPWEGQQDLPETDVDLLHAVMGSGASVPKDVSANSWARQTKSWPATMIALLVNLFIAVICAWIYNRYRFRAALPFAPKLMEIDTRSQVCSCGNFYPPDSNYCRMCGSKRVPEDDFGVGLFTCFSDVKLCLFACCCPCLRWADTVDRAGLLKYWVAFTVFAVLIILSPYTYGITGIVLALVCFGYRQRLRRKYNVAPNNVQDCLAYFFCGTCAVVQEARVEANRPS